jgi:hypothetical protein
VCARQFDPLGAVTVTAALLLLVYAISNAPQVGWSTTRTVALLATSAVLLIAFLVVESRVEAPLMPLRIFRLRTVAAANAVGLLLGGSFFGFIFIGTPYMQQVLGYSVAMHGHFWGSLAAPFFVAGAGTAFSFIPISIAGLAGVAEREAGLASGLLNTSQQLGGAIGVAIASTVATTHMKTLLGSGDATQAALIGGFQWAIWVCEAITLLALPTTAILLRRRRANEVKGTVPALEAGKPWLNSTRTSCSASRAAMDFRSSADQ